MADIVLVGTVHRDPNGHDRLLSILREEGPDCLTLEMSPYAVRYREENRLALRRRVCDILDDLVGQTPAFAQQDPLFHPAIRNVLAMIDFPYEYLAASAFSRSRNIPFRCIDRSDLSRKRLSRLEREIITRENLRALIVLDPDEVCREVDREYSLASMVVHRGKETAYRLQIRREMAMRDRSMARRIRGILHGLRCRKLVHIGGWEHLLDHGKTETLFTLLSDLRPRRRLLTSQFRGDS